MNDYIGRQIDAKPERAATHKPKRRKPRGAVRRRFGLLHTFIDAALSKVSGSEALVWLALYRHARPSGEVSAAVTDLARRTGLGERQTRRALKQLESRGFLERLKRGTLANGPSVYRLVRPAVQPDTGVRLPTGHG